jgi:hypothetical protein
MKINDNKSLCNNRHCRHGMVIWTKWAIGFFLFENVIYMQFNLIFTWLLYTNVRETRRDNQIKNGQSRETGNIGYTRHKTKTNKNKKTTSHKTKNMSNTDQIIPQIIPQINPVYIYPIQINWWRKFIFIVKLVVDKKKECS